MTASPVVVPRQEVRLTGVGQRFTAARGAPVVALAGVDLTIDAGSFVSVVGPSGCGKTTLLRLIAGFERPTEGVVAVGGRPVERPSPERGVVFQRANLYPWMSVRENVALGPRLRGSGRRERRAIADRLLELVGLAEFGDSATYELSGGMQRRCQIAAVLANKPPLMLLDEPFAALDTFTRERLQDALLEIWRRESSTMIFITHSVEEAAYLAQRVVVMSARPGRIVDRVPVPFSPEERRPSLRTDPAFVSLREGIAGAIRREQSTIGVS